MKILIVSDTHRQHAGLQKALDLVRPIDMMIHLGDVEGSENYIRTLAGCPVEMVAGNNDFFSDLDRELEIDLAGTKVLITHGHNYGVSLDPAELIDEAASRGISVVFFGHTHKPVILRRGNITAVNPGSLSYPRQEGRTPSYAVLDIDRQGKFHFKIK